MLRIQELAAFIGIAERECEIDAKTHGMITKQAFHTYVDAVNNFLDEHDRLIDKPEEAAGQS